MSKRQKRVCRMLSVESKLEIITRINRGEKMGDLAVAYGIGRTTIHDIYKNRARIQEFSKAKIYRINKRQNLRRGKNPRLEEALYEWYLQEKKTGMPISFILLLTRAKEIYKEIYDTDEGFPSGDGWLKGFKRRYKVKFTQEDDVLQGDDERNKSTGSEEFKTSFYKKIVDYKLCPSQVYTATQIELCWRVLPGDGYNKKLRKDKIAILSCANASALHKLKLLLVGGTSRALENVNLPVHYYGQKIQRITEQSFRSWFDDCFVTETRSWLTEHNLPPNALLIVDQSLCNSDDFVTKDGSICTLFHPSECKNIMPLDNNVVEEVKLRYKRHLLLTASSRNMPMDEYLKQFNMRDFVYTLAQSWQSIAASKIAASWKGLWDTMVLDIVPDNDHNSDEQYDPILLRTVADDIVFSVDVLRQWLDGKFDSLDMDTMMHECHSEPNENTTVVPVQEAVDSFDKCIQWAEQSNATAEDIALLRKLRDKALISKHPTLCTTIEGEFIEEAEVFGT